MAALWHTGHAPFGQQLACICDPQHCTIFDFERATQFVADGTLCRGYCHLRCVFHTTFLLYGGLTEGSSGIGFQQSLLQNTLNPFWRWSSSRPWEWE